MNRKIVIHDEYKPDYIEIQMQTIYTAIEDIMQCKGER